MSKAFKIFYTILKKVIFVGIIMALFNKLYDLYATRKNILTCKPENIFNWKSQKVYYTRSGSGSPVILLHAIHPAASSFEWDPVREQLVKSHTVYELDLPGCGRSSKDAMMYTSYYYVTLIRDFLETMSIKGAAIVGSNNSSSVAILSSLTAGDNISSVTMVNPPAVLGEKVNSDFFAEIANKILRVPFLGTFIYNMMSLRANVDLAFSEKYFYNPFHDTDDIVDAYFESAHTGNGKGRFIAASLYGNYFADDLSHAAQTCPVPLNIIMGEALEKCDEIVEEWRGTNSSIKVEVIPQTKKLPQLEKPEKTADAIIRCIS